MTSTSTADLGQRTSSGAYIAADADGRADTQPTHGSVAGCRDQRAAPRAGQHAGELAVAAVTTATSIGACSSRSNILRGSVPSGAAHEIGHGTSRPGNRSTPMQDASVTNR